MHKYQHQYSQQTLAEGLAEYHAVSESLEKCRDSSSDAIEFFRCHDTAHVVFGCGTNLNDEVVLKISSIFGTTGGAGILRGYRLHESRRIYSSIRASEIIYTALASFVLVPRTIIRCWLMTKRWHWTDYEMYMEAPLQDVRKEFGIRVAHF
jgi:hypothetical protein